MFSSDNSVIRTSCLPPAIVKRVRRDAITFLFHKLPSNLSVTFYSYFSCNFGIIKLGDRPQTKTKKSFACQQLYI